MIHNLKQVVTGMLRSFAGFGLLAMLIPLILLTGCASVSMNKTKEKGVIAENEPVPPQLTGYSQVTLNQAAWWRVSFSRQWQENPPWYIDVYIAHQVIKPIVDEHGQNLILWRFHRRSVNDAAGHRFSFMFYTTREVANQVFEKVNADPKVIGLLDREVIAELYISDLDDNKQRQIQDGSDQVWTPEIQAAWPEFAMGVSKSWLVLVDEIARKYRDSNAAEIEADDELSIYSVVNDEINKMWEQQGNHAYLHHLNALFGYKELFVIERKLMRF